MQSMTKNSTLIFLGVLVVFSSFLGIPGSWKMVIFNFLGLLIIITAALLRRDITSGSLCAHLTEEKHTDSYRQTGVLRPDDTHEHGESTTGNQE
ncbi:MAG: tetraspanin family protein [Candidatus Pacebacteria bacterium]|nr:tetraspanin family protein [Candidatus Paceibacterota bacterium]